MEFNSLDAQREAGDPISTRSVTRDGECWCRNITTMAVFPADPWIVLRSKLMRDIENGLIDVVVVYKVDRLSRALSDFAKLIDLFDKHNVSFLFPSPSNSTLPPLWDG